jgi:hypothetical protein
MSSKKIMCINTDVSVAELIDRVFHDSTIVRKLGSKCGYTNTSTWLKIAVLYLVQSDPSAEKLAKLHGSCKSDSELLSALAGEVTIAK